MPLPVRHEQQTMNPESAPTTAQPWDGLRRFTDARIALGRAGHSLPTAAHLQFQLAHAQARDAVHVALDGDLVTQGLQALGLSTRALHSAASSRQVYLQRSIDGDHLVVSSHYKRIVGIADGAKLECRVIADVIDEPL